MTDILGTHTHLALSIRRVYMARILNNVAIKQNTLFKIDDFIFVEKYLFIYQYIFCQLQSNPLEM